MSTEPAQQRSSIDYERTRSISDAEFVDVLRRTSLAKRRPVDDSKCIFAAGDTDLGYTHMMANHRVDLSDDLWELSLAVKNESRGGALRRVYRSEDPEPTSRCP